MPADTLVGAYYPWLDYKWDQPTGVPVKNPPISDVFSQFFLWKYLSLDFIRQGIWPLWNPYSFSGTPFLATYHSATLLPFNILLLLPKYFGWGIYIFAQTLVAAIGMFFLLGFYTKKGFARVAGSIVFSLSGLMTTWVEFGTGVWAASMLPWIFFSLESFWKSGKVRFLILLTFSFVCLYLAGHAQLTVYSSVLFLLYIFYKLSKKDFKNRKSLALPLIFWILAIGIFAIQLLPTYDLLGHSIRGDEAYSRSFDYGLNPVYELIRLISADFFGNPTTYNHWDKISYHEQSSFLGAITIPLIIPFLFRRFRSKILDFWGGVFLISLLLAFKSPLTTLIYSLPFPLLTYSSASRIFFVLSFAAGILLAVGIDRFEEDEQFRKLTRRSSAILIAAFVGILIGLFITRQYLQPFLDLKLVSEQINFLMISAKNSLVPMAMLGLTFVLTFRFAKKKLFIYLLVLALFLDLGRFFLKYNPFVPTQFIFPETPVINFLKSQPGLFRISRADPVIITPNTWIAYNLESIEGYDPLYLERSGRFFNRVNGQPYESSVSRYQELTFYPSKYVDALNTKYFLAIKKEGNKPSEKGSLNNRLQGSNYKIVFEDKTSVVLENPDAKERAYFVEEVKTINKQDLGKNLNDLSFNPSKSALIYQDIKVSNLSGDGEVKILSYTPNYLSIFTKTTSQQFLVLADTYDRGWQLFENGKRAELFEVNGVVRGIMVKEGENLFELKYWPKSFDLGLKISLVSILALVLLTIILAFKKIKV